MSIDLNDSTYQKYCGSVYHKLTLPTHVAHLLIITCGVYTPIR